MNTFQIRQISKLEESNRNLFLNQNLSFSAWLDPLSFILLNIFTHEYAITFCSYFLTKEIVLGNVTYSLNFMARPIQPILKFVWPLSHTSPHTLIYLSLSLSLSLSYPVSSSQTYFNPLSPSRMYVEEFVSLVHKKMVKFHKI